MSGWENTFGMGVEVLGHYFETVGRDAGGATARGDVGVEGDDEESLFGRVEEVDLRFRISLDV